jgi:hypothetical protein
MRLPKIRQTGDAVAEIELTGLRKNVEPDHMRISFPGGCVDVVRATDTDGPDFWVHVIVNHERHGLFIPDETIPGRITDARIDTVEDIGRKPSQGDFGHDAVNHVAMRVRPFWGNESKKP